MQDGSLQAPNAIDAKIADRTYVQVSKCGPSTLNPKP